jgi:hypothetical protein
LRKYLIVALAGVAAIAFSAVAFAQLPAPAPKMEIKSGKAKAGTKKKPKNVTLDLFVENNVESKTTMDTLDVHMPKAFVLNGAGLPKCDYAKLATEGTDACPKGSKAGTGAANAVLGPHGAAPSPLAFTVTAFNGGKKEILFWLDQDGGDVEAALKGVVKKSKGKYGQVLSIKVPDGKGEYAAFPNIQQPAPGVYSALVDLGAKISLKKGKKSLISSVGCKGGKHPFKAVLTYSDNPTPPASRTAETTDSTKCKK